MRQMEQQEQEEISPQAKGKQRNIQKVFMPPSFVPFHIYQGLNPLAVGEE